MGFFSKLTFWKHEEEKLPDLPGFGGSEASTDLTSPGRDTTGLGEPRMPETPPQPFGQEQTNYPNVTPPPGTPPPQSFQAPQQEDIASKNMEIISSKLDFLKASLENINQRLTNLENIAKGEEQKPRYKW